MHLHSTNTHTHAHTVQTKRFRYPGQEGPQESLHSTASGIVDWHSHTHSLRDVVESYSNGQSSAERRGGEGGHKRRQPLGDVVESNCQSRESPHSLQTLLVGCHHLCHVSELLWSQWNKILKQWWMNTMTIRLDAEPELEYQALNYSV